MPAAAICFLAALVFAASSAGAERIYFTESAREPHVAQLWSVRPDGGGLQRLRPRLPVGPQGGVATLSRDGRRILCICRAGEVDSVRLDGTHLRRLGPLPRAVRYDIVTLGSTGTAYWLKGAKRIVSQQAASGRRRTFAGVGAPGAVLDFAIAPSPDGSRIAYVAYGCLDPACTDDETETLLTARADGSDRTVVYQSTGLGKEIWEVAWSADGSRLVFSDGTGEGSPKGELPVYFPRTYFTAAADGSTPQGILLALPENSSDPFFSPDGTRLAFAAFVGSKPGLWTAAADGSAPTSLLRTSCGYHYCEFSPRVFGWR